MKKILLAVTEDNYGTVITPEVETKIKALGEVVQRKDLRAKRPDGADPERAYAEAVSEVQPEIIVTGWGTATLTADAWRAGPPPAYLCHCAGTVRRIVAREVLEAGLLVSNWGRLPAPTVAEAALMMTLAGLRKASGYVRLLDRGGWRSDEFDSRSLFGRKVGVQGLGVIAQEYVRLLGPFDCDVSAYSPHCPDDAFERLGVRRETDLARLYAENDVISVHASNTPENHHIVNREILNGMKDGAVLVNTARGAILDEAALVDKLKEGRIWAALDVFETEPLPEDSPLRGLKNVLLLPHQAGPTPDWRPRMGEHALENLTRYVSGEKVTDVVTLRKYDLIT
jgi:phosphoglycerate dehydrogenase-like enzyme